MNTRLLTMALAITVLLVACSAPPATTPIPDSADGDAPEVPTLEPTEAPTLPPPVVVVGGENVEGQNTDGETGDDAPPAESDAPPGPWPREDFGYGIQSHAVVGDPKVAMDVTANQLGLDWVKFQLEWPLVQPEPGDELRQWFFYDGAFDEASRHGLRVLISVVGAPAWTRAAGNEIGPPDDYNLFADFLEEVIRRYQGQVHAIEVWNEQNLDREWTTANGISPEDYVRFLEVAYNRIRAVDPDIVVVSGALAPTGDGDWVKWADDFAYMDRAVAAGMLQFADCVGVHHNGYNIPPDVPFEEAPSHPEAETAEFRGPFENPHHSWSFKTTIDGYAERVHAVDPDMPLCVTEFGWPSSEGYDAVPEGFGFALDNTEAEQAAYIVQAFEQMRTSGDVWLAFLFNLDFGNKGNGPTDDPVPYSIIRYPDGAPRPAFGAVAEMPKLR